MAQALECPACGARHRLDSIPDARTFRCDRCGQVLKVPDSVTPSRASTSPSSSAPAPSPPPRRGSAGGGGVAAAPAPPPRRRDGSVPVGPSVSATATATLPVVEADESEPPMRRRRDAAPTPLGPPARKVHWWWRLLAWIAAVPLGLLVTAWPALQLDLLKKDDLLDVFVGEGTGRYVRLLIFAAVWALVTALLVQLFVEGGRWLMARRRARTR